ncbi:hypothetical protein N7486_000003 [Penicillium sp. IBT 16267x]|nr:hypothetical protein N7486_000003 [Penicillium sp. IBT 16267x]
MIGLRPPGAFHPWPGGLEGLEAGRREISGLFLYLQPYALTLLDRGNVSTYSSVWRDFSHGLSLVDDDPVLAGGALCPGLEKDIIIEVVGSAMAADKVPTDGAVEAQSAGVPFVELQVALRGVAGGNQLGNRQDGGQHWRALGKARVAVGYKS